MTVKNVYDRINQAADFSLAMDFDNPGLLVGDPNAQVTSALAALDVTDAVIAEAVECGANLIVTHHPVIFHPLKKVTADMLVWKLIRNNLAVVSAHTNLDAAKGGVNDILAEKLELLEIEPLQNEEGLGRKGKLSRGMTPPELAYYTKQKLNVDAVRYCDGGQAIQKIAVCGGSGGSLLECIAANDCQAFITGDVKHDVMLDAVHRGITLIDAGHFGTETVVVDYLAQLTGEVVGKQNVAIAKSNIPLAVTI